MNWLDRQILKLRPGLAKRRSVRAFTAAQNTNLTADWKTTQYTADQQIRFDLYGLRSRARDLALNDPYIRRWMRLRRTNIVGPNGFSLQLRAGDWKGEKFVLDNFANRLIESKFADWSKAANCCVDGKSTFLDIENLACDHLGRDGEVFIRKIRSKKFKYGLKLQIIEPDLINERINQTAEGSGNAIKMGVEVDEWRKPIAYCITKVTPGLEVYYVSQYSSNYERVLADEIYHVYDAERAFQTRGFPQMASAMYRVKMLEGYEDAATVNARASAMKGGFFTSEDGETFEGNDTDGDNNTIMDLESGEWKQLPPGVKPFQVDPKYPDQQHSAFTKVILRGIASALGVAYESLANDYENSSYSSARTSMMNERDNWKREQNFFVEKFLSPLFADWLIEASLAGAFVNANGNSLPIESKFEKFNSPLWLGKRWDWVDPENEVNANLKLVSAGLKTATEILADQGKDITEVYSTLEGEKDLAEAHGLNLSFGPNDGRTSASAGTNAGTNANQAVKSLLTEVGIPTNGNGHAK